MSSTYYIYARRGDILIPFFAVGGSYSISEAFSARAPYEAICEISPRMLEGARSYLRAICDGYDRRKAEVKEELESLATWNNSIDDKLTAYNNLRADLAEIQRESEEYTEGLAALTFLECAPEGTTFYIGIDIPDATIENIKPENLTF